MIEVEESLKRFFGVNQIEPNLLIPERGGSYSRQLNIWFDDGIDWLVDDFAPPDRIFTKAMAKLALAIGQAHKVQTEDAEQKRMWPKEFFGEKGRLLDAAGNNPSISDPYCLLADGADKQGIPYSHAYRKELAEARQAITQAGVSGSSSVSHLKGYLDNLLKVYTYDPGRTTDLPFIHDADCEWVKIPPESEFLVFAEPTEAYQDPLRVSVGQDRQVNEWVGQVEANIGIPPWRNFFEFRLMQKSEDMITQEEISAIRETSRSMYERGSAGKVLASLEFRRLLLGSGQGIYPAKSAKNYPNFEDIRKNYGYKNVVYTNMVKMSVETELLLALKTTFKKPWLKDKNLPERLVRGKCLLIVAHEENHPFKRMSDTTLEELKSSINGMHAVAQSRRFSKQEIEDMILSEIAAALDNRRVLQEAILKNDQVSQRAIDAYYKEGMIFLNHLLKEGVFDLGINCQATDINFELLQEAVASLVRLLDQARDKQVRPSYIYQTLGKEDIWKVFSA